MVLIEDVFEIIKSYFDKSLRIYLPSKTNIKDIRAVPIQKMKAAADLAKGVFISAGGLLSTLSMQLADVGKGPEQPERMMNQSGVLTDSLVDKVKPYVTFEDP